MGEADVQIVVNEAEERMEAGLGEEGNQTFARHVWSLWIDPEIERRRQAGTLPDDFGLYRVQVIFRYDSLPEVRLNDEVKMLVIAEVDPMLVLGDQVRVNDLDKILSVDLTEVDANAGHITLILHRDRWVGRFDFRYQGVSSRQHLDRAREYLDVAAAALDRGTVGPCLDNLFSAAELMAKAELQMHDRAIALGMDDRGKRLQNLHQERRRRYSRWAKSGNTEQRYADLLDHLWDLRGAARYMEAGPLPTIEEARDMVETAEAMYTYLDARVPRPRLVSA
jgi:HEPN domain